MRAEFKNKKVLPLRLEKELYDIVRRLAFEAEIPMSEYIRSAIVLKIQRSKHKDLLK